jgi:hypothetical protein
VVFREVDMVEVREFCGASWPGRAGYGRGAGGGWTAGPPAGMCRLLTRLG